MGTSFAKELDDISNIFRCLIIHEPVSENTRVYILEDAICTEKEPVSLLHLKIRHLHLGTITQVREKAPVNEITPNAVIDMVLCLVDDPFTRTKKITAAVSGMGNHQLIPADGSEHHGGSHLHMMEHIGFGIKSIGSLLESSFQDMLYTIVKRGLLPIIADSCANHMACHLAHGMATHAVTRHKEVPVFVMISNNHTTILVVSASATLRKRCIINLTHIQDANLHLIYIIEG